MNPRDVRKESTTDYTILVLVYSRNIENYILMVLVVKLSL